MVSKKYSTETGNPEHGIKSNSRKTNNKKNYGNKKTTKSTKK